MTVVADNNVYQTVGRPHQQFLQELHSVTIKLQINTKP